MKNTAGKIIRVLIVDDSEDDTLLILRELGRGEFAPVCERVDTAEQMQSALVTKTWDVVIADYTLPKFSAIHALKILQEKGLDIPFIVVSGMIGEEKAVEMMKIGAHDYVMKNNLKRLPHAVIREIHDTNNRSLQSQAKAALIESEKLLREAQTLGRIGNWVFDLTTRQITWSDMVFDLYERDKNLGPPTVEEEAGYYTPEQTKKLREYVKSASENDRELKYDIVVNLPSGKTRFFSASMRPVKDSNGRVVKVFGTVQDITERKLYEEQLMQSYQKLEKALIGTINALGIALEKRDPYTANHQRRVTKLACAMAEEMGLSEKQIEGIKIAGSLHDIGKIYVPAEILSKPSNLTKAEFDIVKTHASGGYEILQSVEFPWPVAAIILQHHERMNGSGYPNKLTGESIMMESRILAVADVVEAMASHRPYRPAKGIDQVLDEITQNGGALYDLAAVDACLKVFRQRSFRFEQ